MYEKYSINSKNNNTSKKSKINRFGVNLSPEKIL